MDQQPNVTASQSSDTYMPVQQPAPEAAATAVPEKDQKRKEHRRKTLLRIIISILVIAVGVFLILYFVAKASLYDSIGSMLQHMFVELTLMWERITS